MKMKNQSHVSKRGALNDQNELIDNLKAILHKQFMVFFLY